MDIEVCVPFGTWHGYFNKHFTRHEIYTENYKLRNLPQLFAEQRKKILKIVCL